MPVVLWGHQSCVLDKFYLSFLHIYLTAYQIIVLPCLFLIPEHFQQNLSPVDKILWKLPICFKVLFQITGNSTKRSRITFVMLFVWLLTRRMFAMHRCKHALIVKAKPPQLMLTVLTLNGRLSDIEGFQQFLSYWVLNLLQHVRLIYL